MTGGELVKYIQRHHLENHVIEIQYRDDDGFYYGTDWEPLLCEIQAFEDSNYRDAELFDRLIL